MSDLLWITYILRTTGANVTNNWIVYRIKGAAVVKRELINTPRCVWTAKRYRIRKVFQTLLGAGAYASDNPCAEIVDWLRVGIYNLWCRSTIHQI